MVGGEQDKTLFDFVDAETVQSLQQDALEQAKEWVDHVAHVWNDGKWMVTLSLLFLGYRLEELLAAHEHALTRITAIYKFFRTFDDTYGSDTNALVGEQRRDVMITYVSSFSMLVTVLC